MTVLSSSPLSFATCAASFFQRAKAKRNSQAYLFVRNLAVVLCKVGKIVVLFASGCSGALAQTPENFPINHFIYIIQENHTFDSYFGTFPNACGIPPGTSLPEHPGGPPKYKPFHLAALHIPKDLSHAWQAARTAYDDGRMDGFIWAEWPQALNYYWGAKPVPTPNPKLVHPVPTPTPAAITDDDEDCSLY